MSVDQRYEPYSNGGTFPLFVVREAGSPGPEKPKLRDRVQMEIPTCHYSPRTEKCYVGFLSLAVHARVSASTQNQAFSALLFLYREVLRRDLAGIENVVRARVPRHLPRHLPVVMTRDEAGRCSPTCRGRRG